MNIFWEYIFWLLLLKILRKEVSLLTHESVHFISALIIGLYFYQKHRNWRLILAALVIGFFIDVDHLFDYFAYFGLRFNLFYFLNVATYMGPAQKIYVLFHGWEFILLLWLSGKILGNKYKLPELGSTLVFPYAIHLLIDQFSGYTTNYLAYFLTFRILTGFSMASYHGL